MIKNIGASVRAFTISAGDIGFLEAENILTKFLKDEIADEFNKYLSFKLGVSRSKVRGKKILLEFLLDAKDPSQTDRLVEFLKGDLGIIKKLMEMGDQLNETSDEASLEEGQNQINNVEDVAEDSLGAESNFAGTNHFNAQTDNFNIQLPIIISHQNGNTLRYDRYQTIGGDQVLHVHQASRNKENRNLNIPIAGTIIKHNTWDNVYIANYEKKGEKVEDPVIVYQRYDGTVRRSERTVRDMVGEINDIMKYAGTKGEGTNESYVIDTDALFPHLLEPQYDEDGFATEHNRRYKSSILSFTLLFTREAVRDIISAPAKTIMKAFFNILEGFDKEIMDKVAHLFFINDEGKADYDWREVRKIIRDEYWWLDPLSSDDEDPMDSVRYICWQATRIIKDFDYIRSAGGWKEQSKRLAEVFAGEKKGHLKYNKMMRLVVQFTDPENLYARFKFDTRKKIDGEEDLHLNQGMFNEELQEPYNAQWLNATALRDMFNNPLTLTD